MKNNHNIYYSKDFIKNFALIFLPLITIMIALTLFIVKTNNEKGLFSIKSNEISTLAYFTKVISNQFKSISSDLFILSESEAIKDYLINETADNLFNAEKLFFSFAKRKMIYDQIRFLDINGNEKIRINYNDDNPSAVENNRLQNKRDRYYFQNAIRLPKESIYISPFDLNIEDGKIEKPIKPMIRFSTPVYDSKNVLQGVVVLNYLGKKVLDHLQASNINSISEAMLVNKDGYWLYNINEEDEWGFLFNEKKHKKFQLKYKSAWSEISKNTKGQFNYSDGLYTYTTIRPLEEIYNYFNKKNAIDKFAQNYYWKLILFCPERELYETVSSNWNKVLAITLFITIIIFGISIFVARAKVLRKRAAELEKKMQEELKKSELKLIKLNADKDKFFSIISHDLRSPFHGIIGTMHILKNNFEELDENELKEAITMLDNSINGVYDLLDGLLEWSRMQTGRMEFEPEITNVSEICHSVTQLLQTNANSKNITLTNSIDEEVKVFADKNMLNSIIRNLVSNAIKFSKNGGEIKYSATRENNKIKIIVSDKGIGMTDEDSAKLFRIDVHHTTPGTEDESGTGVGLILCKSFVEKNGGKIWVKSELGIGSKFIFTIPVG